MNTTRIPFANFSDDKEWSFPYNENNLPKIVTEYPPAIKDSQKELKNVIASVQDHISTTEAQQDPNEIDLEDAERLRTMESFTFDDFKKTNSLLEMYDVLFELRDHKLLKDNSMLTLYRSLNDVFVNEQVSLGKKHIFEIIGMNFKYNPKDDHVSLSLDIQRKELKPNVSRLGSIQW